MLSDSSKFYYFLGITKWQARTPEEMLSYAICALPDRSCRVDPVGVLRDTLVRLPVPDHVPPLCRIVK